MISNLIVPVNVRALRTNDRTEPRARLGATADYTNLPRRGSDRNWRADQPFIGSSVEQFQSCSIAAGVTLHWQLPDGLIRGAHDPATGAIVFPSVPNRWLVVRALTHADAPAGTAPWIKSWVIESDRVRLNDEGQGCATFPFVDGSQDPNAVRQFYRYLGRYGDYADWAEDSAGVFFADVAQANAAARGGSGPGFTALGYGDPSFAAYAPKWPPVFSFHDSFETSLLATDDGGRPAEDPLAQSYLCTYTVCGWYGGKTPDPAAGLTAADNDRRWTFTGEPPARSLFAGSVAGLRWDPLADYAYHAHPVEVAVGNSQGEALSALIAATVPQADAGSPAEDLLNAVQTGLLKRLSGEPGWIPKLDAELHRRGFASEAGDFLWTVVARDEVAKITQDDPAAADLSRPGVDLPDSLARDLAALNAAQQAYDRAQATIETRRRQLYLDWCRYQQLTANARLQPPETPAEAPLLTTANAADLLSALQAAIAAAVAQTGVLRCTFPAHDDADQNDRLSADPARGDLALAAAKAWQTVVDSLDRGLVLKRSPGPRFWRPADPVVLLRGQDVAAPARNRAAADADARTYLPCRRSDEVIATITHASGAKLAAADIARADEWARLDPDISADVNALVAESLLLDPRFDAWIADKLGAGTASDVAALRASLAGMGPTAALTASGTLPHAIARTDGGSTEWTPLLLRWTVEHGSVLPPAGPAETATLPADILTAHHRLDAEAVDLDWRAETRLSPEHWHSFSSYAPLTANAVTDLAREIADAEKADPDPELEAIAASLKAAPIQAQAIGGFHDSLQMLASGPQLPVADPLVPRMASRFAPYALADAHPDPLAQFTPIRSGPVRLAALEVIDVFGRSLGIDVSQVHWAKAVRGADGAGLLPARLAQAARLQFRWLSATNDEVEANSHPATSPVCGWVLPDFYADSLALYAADGTALGAMALVGGGGQSRWIPAPCADAPQDAAAIPNQHLRDFASAVLAQPAGHLDAMLRVIDRSVSLILPPGAPRDPSLGVLLGRPLALVRASLSVEVKGDPAAHQGWLSMQGDAIAASAARTGNAAWTGRRDTRGWERIAVPVRLGNLAQAHDGLVGYFRDDLFRSPAATDGMVGVASSADADIALSVQDAPLPITMLFDPFAQISATTGIFPVKTLSLPEGLYAPALARLNATFYAGPVLFQPNANELPTPQINGLAWSWRQRGSDSTWTAAPLAPWPGDRGQVDYDTQQLAEGWLSLTPISPAGNKST
jgi:hypothetical protein